MARAGESSGTPSVLGNCSRPSLADAVRSVYVSQLGGWPSQSQLPIVYSPNYNIDFYGVERFHPFDSTKFSKVVKNLVQWGVLQASQLIAPLEVTHEMLLDVHTEAYLTAVRQSSWKMAEVTEMRAIGLLPNWVVQHKLHRPMRFHVGGTMLALALALQYGWSINLGGGMHHAHFEDGGGWCVYDDWVLALRMLRRETGGRIQKALMIDLDVHQGNGHERDKLHFNDADLYILDVYNADQWPWDEKAKGAINFEGAMRNGTSDEEYLELLAHGLETGFRDFAPDIVLYNAGTDILKGDPLGSCCVSAEGVAKRDEMVFEAARKAGVPICMALSGGYAKNSAYVISRCLQHVIEKLELIKPCSKL